MGLFGKNAGAGQDGARHWTNVIKNSGPGGLLPVSYTHLDVYKRQVHIPLSPPEAPYQTFLVYHQFHKIACKISSFQKVILESKANR